MLYDVPGASVVLEQQGNNVSMTPTSHPQCGQIHFEGTTDGTNFSLKQYMTNTELPYCRSWTQYDGVFKNNNCNKIEGTLTMHIEGTNDVKAPFNWFRHLIQIISPTTDNLIITAEPRMPNFEAIAVLNKPELQIRNSASPYTWHLSIKHTTVPGRINHYTNLDDEYSIINQFKPDFTKLKDTKNNLINGIMGGELILAVEYYQAVGDEKKYVIKGTNPGKNAVESHLTDKIARQIACQESRYRQFIASRENGVGFPVVGEVNHVPIGGIGMMQIYTDETPPKQVWNWKENIYAGLEKISISRQQSGNAHIKERVRLNNERQLAGLPLCPEGIPTKLNPEQENRETIRRYNCGREYRWEPRDAPNCKGQWVVDLSCERQKKQGYDKNYVENVIHCELDK